MTNKQKIVVVVLSLGTAVAVYYAYKKFKTVVFDQEYQDAIYAWVMTAYNADTLTWYLSTYVDENGGWSRLKSAVFDAAGNMLGRKTQTPMNNFDFSHIAALAQQYNTFKKLPGGAYMFSIKHRGSGFDVPGFLKSVVPIALTLI